MGILQENNINLLEVEQRIFISVEDLIRLDNEGETKLFNNAEECFYWMFIEGSKDYMLAETMERMAKLDDRDLLGRTVAETMIESNSATLEDGRVVYVYL